MLLTDAPRITGLEWASTGQDEATRHFYDIHFILESVDISVKRSGKNL